MLLTNKRFEINRRRRCFLTCLHGCVLPPNTSRCGEGGADLGRVGQMWGGWGRCGEDGADVGRWGRCGEGGADVGRVGQMHHHHMAQRKGINHVKHMSL